MLHHWHNSDVVVLPLREITDIQELHGIQDARSEVAIRQGVMGCRDRSFRWNWGTIQHLLGKSRFQPGPDFSYQLQARSSQEEGNRGEQQGTSQDSGCRLYLQRKYGVLQKVEVRDRRCRFEFGDIECWGATRRTFREN